jgi:hypothetical protein
MVYYVVNREIVPKNNEEYRVINFYPYILTMNGKNQDGEQASKEVTVVVNRKIKPG